MTARSVDSRPHAARTSAGLVDETQAAQYLGGISPRTLQAWRSVRGGWGPAFVRLGRRVFYRREDLDAFIRRGLSPAPVRPARAPMKRKRRRPDC